MNNKYKMILKNTKNANCIVNYSIFNLSYILFYKPNLYLYLYTIKYI